MHLFEELASRRKLLCPETKAPVEVRGSRVVSESGRDFGPLPGPLNFLKSCRETLDPSQIPASDVERVRVHLELPASNAVDAEIARAIAATGARFAEAHLSAEARILAERFRIPAFEIAGGEPAQPSRMDRVVSALGRMFHPPAAPEHRLEHLSNTVGARVMTGQEVFRSVRVRNAGNASLQAAEPGASRIETRWIRSDGSALPELTLSNELPVDIEPGREITLILRVRPPADAGGYRMEVHLVTPGLPPGAAIATVAVEAISCELPIFEYAYFPDLLEYGPDHHVAMVEALEFLKQQYPGKSTSVLEIGGGVHPTGHAIAAHGHRVVSSDISHSQSILGTLFFQHKMPALAESLAFISCDGTDLPFGEDAFDGVMLFAAFHHFADPRGLLEEMKRVIRQDGFIFLGCENCAPNPADPQYREELRRGINEQMWTLAELTDFFRAAGLRVVRARVDRHSLKVGLVKA